MADLLQFKILTSATIQETFHLNGVPKDLDAGVPTVTITRPDGTTIAPGTVSHVGGVDSGTYKFVLSGQPTPTILDVRWTGMVGGESQRLESTIEILGALLFTVPAFRALRVANGTPFSLTAVPFISENQIMEERAAVLDELCEILGYSPVPRFARETHHGVTPIKLDRRHASNPPLSVTVGGVSQLATSYHLEDSGLLWPAANYQVGAAIPNGLANVTVEYVHGLPRIPGKGSHLAMMWAAQYLNPSGFSSATTVSMPDGSTYTYEPAEQGRGGFQRHTGNRELDRWLNRHAGIAVG